MVLDDQQLINNAQTDPQEFSVLYKKYVDELRTFIYYRCNRQEDVADDLTADIFMNAFRSLSKFKWQGYSYRSYLYQLARNRLIDYYRTSSQATYELNPESVEYRDSIPETVDLHLLWKDIKQLGPNVTEIFELRYLQGLSFDEIADILGKSAGSLRTLVSRTIDELGQRLSL